MRVGWDELDEYVLEDLLGMLRGSEEAKRYTDLVRRLAELALTQLRHENARAIEPHGIPALCTYALRSLSHRSSAGLGTLGLQADSG